MTQVSPRVPHNPRLKFVLVVIIVVGLVGTVVGVAFVTQQAPPVTVSANTILPQCDKLTAPSLAPAGSGTIQFTCGTGPAFESPNGGTSTVTFHGNTTNLFCP